MEGQSYLPEGSPVRGAPTFARAALAFVTSGAPAPVAEARTAAILIDRNSRRFCAGVWKRGAKVDDQVIRRPLSYAALSLLDVTSWVLLALDAVRQIRNAFAHTLCSAKRFPAVPSRSSIRSSSTCYARSLSLIAGKRRPRDLRTYNPRAGLSGYEVVDKQPGDPQRGTTALLRQ